MVQVLTTSIQPGPPPFGPNVRRTSPVRGLGPNEVDLRGTRSPSAAISMTASKVTGFEMTAVPGHVPFTGGT